ncbi:MAG: FHA domain-containing protein [Kitasatospora sp.]|jgi:hypothetical protein|nr:FHA domain-containing protein [Kitasatospora sp.]
MNDPSRGGPPIQPLSLSVRTLADGPPERTPPLPAGALCVLAAEGGVMAVPRDGRRVTFGRNEPAVDVCVGRRDGHVSRLQGSLTHYGDTVGEWWLRNEGQATIRTPTDRLVTGQQSVLPEGYTPLFIVASAKRQFLVEVLVVTPLAEGGTVRPGATTVRSGFWTLSDQEHLVLAALAQNYLLALKNPQPISAKQTAMDLNDIAGQSGWTERKVQNMIQPVRLRLSRAGIPGLLREDFPTDNVGNIINHNLIQALLDARNLAAPDLRMLGLED